MSDASQPTRIANPFYVGAYEVIVVEFRQLVEKSEVGSCPYGGSRWEIAIMEFGK